MPNPIKYNSSTEDNALNVGNFWIGTGDVDKGPTSITGYYNGITPPPNGYTIYVHKLNQGPSIRIASDDSELIEITNDIASASYTTITQCFNYFEGQSDKMVTHQTMNFRITDGLVLDLDGNNIPSYPHNGSTWHDLSGGGNSGTLINGPSFNSNGYFNFDGTDDFIDLGNQSLITDDFCIDLWYKLTANKEHYIFTTGYGNAGSILIFSDGIWLNSSSSNGRMPGAPGRTLNVWTNITVERTNGIAKWYRNGIYQYSLNYSGNISTNTNYSIGWAVPRNKASAYMEGDFYSAKVYNKGFTESEVQQNYYQAPIVTDGLVFAVDAGNLVSYENGDTTTYSLTGSSTGTLTNGVGFNSGYGGVWEFDGTDDYITLPSSIATALNGGTEASVCIWIKLTNQSNGVGDTGIIQLSGFNSSNGNLYFYSNGYTYLDIFRTDRVSQVFANSSVTATDWHMLTITTTPGTNGWKCYINTTLKKQVTGQSTVSVNSTIQGGLTLGENSGGRYTNGNIASCFIYDKALTADEVSKNYHATKYKFNHA